MRGFSGLACGNQAPHSSLFADACAHSRSFFCHNMKGCCPVCLTLQMAGQVHRFFWHWQAVACHYTSPIGVVMLDECVIVRHPSRLQQSCTGLSLVAWLPSAAVQLSGCWPCLARNCWHWNSKQRGSHQYAGVDLSLKQEWYNSLSKLGLVQALAKWHLRIKMKISSKVGLVNWCFTVVLSWQFLQINLQVWHFSLTKKPTLCCNQNSRRPFHSLTRMEMAPSPPKSWVQWCALWARIPQRQSCRTWSMKWMLMEMER